MTTDVVAGLEAEYRRFMAHASIHGEGPGRAEILGWDLEYTSPSALSAFVDQIGYRRMNDAVLEPDQPVILDCGANIGYTVLHYKRLFPRARITAFEPDPLFAPILRRNLARNGADDVEIVEAAVWTRDGHAPWMVEGKDGSRLATATGGAPDVEVATVDLARYLNQDIDLLKLDIEGAEFDVVPHVATHLHRVRNVLVEGHIVDQSTFDGLATLLTTLRGTGFTLALNTYGPWRDLTRRPWPAPLHAEQYLLISGWRTEPQAVERTPTYAPYVGLALHDQWIDPRGAQEARVHRILAGLACDPSAWVAMPMSGPFQPGGGACVTWRVPAGAVPGDAEGRSGASTLILEDGHPLGPGQVQHDVIRTHGAGRFSHWESHLYWSTSDNSDPNTNGRRYTAIFERAPVPAEVPSTQGDAALRV
ncbi:MAG: FkbM family methyltransferase [Vicinamibacterales bacterium]|nr:FkbM family methyltransferase [Vicinamibacterales bacterium]